MLSYQSKIFIVDSWNAEVRACVRAQHARTHEHPTMTITYSEERELLSKVYMVVITARNGNQISNIATIQISADVRNGINHHLVAARMPLQKAELHTCMVPDNR
jgi:hypothetical protein